MRLRRPRPAPPAQPAPSPPPRRLSEFAATADDSAASAWDSELWRMFVSHDDRQIHKWTHYLLAYDEQFTAFRDGFPTADGGRRPLRMLEIGVRYGGSLQLWRRWFGPDAVIFGIDLNPAVVKEPDPALEIRIGSQADPEFLRQVVAEMGGVDLVLDDGSHMAEHQRASFDTLFPLLSDGGVYAVEDLHTSYWEEYGGELGRGESFIELTKTLIDDMHAWYHHGPPLSGVAAHEWVPKITMYDSIVFIAKASRRRPRHLRVGRKTY